MKHPPTHDCSINRGGMRERGQKEKQIDRRERGRPKERDRTRTGGGEMREQKKRRI